MGRAGEERKTIGFDPVKLKKLDSIFPGVAIGSIVDKLLDKLIEAYEENPIDYAAIGARKLKEEMDL